MFETIKLDDIYDKNINFLIGSGASHGMFPTLALKIKDSEGNPQTLETLATLFRQNNDNRNTPLFMHYYMSCIRPAQIFRLGDAEENETKKTVITNYEVFLETVLGTLQRRKPLHKTCNIFTTNYDGCIPLVADRILQRGSIDFVLNDGARGFSRRYLQARNFNTYLCQTGVFERHTSSIPQINLVYLHGSVYWTKDGANIIVDHSEKEVAELLSEDIKQKLQPFSTCLMHDASTINDLQAIDIAENDDKAFWNSYNQLPIVNPTKWKFHETVFEEHYYQMLRMLSYELEKPNAILITFGFSFADEHILSLVKRSLSNPSAQVFVCCFDSTEETRLSEEFKTHRNVKCLTLKDDFLDFSNFNKKVFTPTPQDVAKPVATTATETVATTGATSLPEMGEAP
jgi:SIR2-like domain